MSSEKQDPVKVAPHNHKVLFENEKVRVFEANLKKGQKLPMHWHSHSVVYMLTNAKVKSTSPDGSIRTNRMKAGVALWHAEWTTPSHAVENLGSSTIRWITIELKESKS